jgi:cysteine desulfuration protein SufE
LRVTAALRDIIDTFQSVDAQTRMELLLDYSKKLPPLPERLWAARDAGIGRIHECMTPVFLYIERTDAAGSTNGVIRIHADVAPEAPTVRGFVSLLVRALEGSSREEVQQVPNDLVHQLGLNDLLRMNREVGLSAVLSRIKREAMASG